MTCGPPSAGLQQYMLILSSTAQTSDALAQSDTLYLPVSFTVPRSATPERRSHCYQRPTGGPSWHLLMTAVPSRGRRQSCRDRWAGRQTEAGMLQGRLPAQAIIDAEQQKAQQPGPATLRAKAWLGSRHHPIRRSPQAGPLIAIVTMQSLPLNAMRYLQGLGVAVHHAIAQQPIAIPRGNMQGRRAQVGQLSSLP